MCLLFSGWLTWTFLAATAWRLAVRQKSLTSDTVRLSPAPIITSNALINVRLKKGWKVRGREENKKWIVKRKEMTETVTTHWGDTPPLVLHKRQMRRTDETECKAVSGRSVHRRSTSFVLHRDVEEREEIKRGWMVVGQEGWRTNRRVVGNVKVDFHLGCSLLTGN